MTQTDRAKGTPLNAHTDPIFKELGLLKLSDVRLLELGKFTFNWKFHIGITPEMLMLLTLPSVEKNLHRFSVAIKVPSTQ